MDNIESLKQMIQSNKMNFDHNYMLMMSNYEQNNFLLYSLLNQATSLPREAKSAIETWLKAYSEGVEGLKIMSDEGYKMIEKSMSSASQ